jgi:hypothetical protein
MYILQRMRLSRIYIGILTLFFCVQAFGQSAVPASATPAAGQRYGVFNLLDHRSIYGQFWFPEPLRGPETDVDRELRLDYFHGEGQDRQADQLKAELEYNVGLLTFELELPYERESESFSNSLTRRIDRDTSEGVPAIELSARHPVYQYVSDDNFFDYTLVGALEVAVPSGSKIGKDTEVVPQLFQAIRLGDHFSIQTTAGLSMLIGPDEGGTNAFEYNVVFGYNLEHDELPLPGVLRTVPIFELNGETGLNRGEHGKNELFGTIGARFNLQSIGVAQPRIGLGYVFPIDEGAREELDWGIITSLVFEF